MIEPIQFISASAINAGLVILPAYAVAAVKRSKPVAHAASITLILFMLYTVDCCLQSGIRLQVGITNSSEQKLV